MSTIDQFVAATQAGGNTTYRDLRPGDLFSFPQRQGIIWVKLASGWYQLQAWPGAGNISRGRKYRTGSATAVIKLHEKTAKTEEGQ